MGSEGDRSGSAHRNTTGQAGAAGDGPQVVAGVVGVLRSVDWGGLIDAVGRAVPESGQAVTALRAAQARTARYAAALHALDAPTVRAADRGGPVDSGSSSRRWRGRDGDGVGPDGSGTRAG